jgi:hypothetical protein
MNRLIAFQAELEMLAHVALAMPLGAVIGLSASSRTNRPGFARIC